MGASEMSLKCNFTTFYVHWFGKIFKKSSKFSKTAPSAPKMCTFDTQKGRKCVLLILKKVPPLGPGSPPPNSSLIKIKSLQNQYQPSEVIYRDVTTSSNFKNRLNRATALTSSQDAQKIPLICFTYSIPYFMRWVFANVFPS